MLCGQLDIHCIFKKNCQSKKSFTALCSTFISTYIERNIKLNFNLFQQQTT